MFNRRAVVFSISPLIARIAAIARMTAIARIAAISRIAAIADRQTGRQTYGQIGRQTDRHADRYVHTVSTKIYHPRIEADAKI